MRTPSTESRLGTTERLGALTTALGALVNDAALTGEGHDPAGIESLIARTPAQFVPGAACSSIILTAPGHKRSRPLAPRGSATEWIDVLQFVVAQGPCVDALAAAPGELVSAPDLFRDDRWPRLEWATRGMHDLLPVRGGAACGLRVPDGHRAALNLYSAPQQEEALEPMEVAAAAAAVGLCLTALLYREQGRPAARAPGPAETGRA